MNPAALEYYQKWMQRRSSPTRLYFGVCVLILAFFIFFTVFFRVRLGDWSFTGSVVALAGIASLGSALLVWVARTASKIGSWTLLERLEAGHRAGHYREVWRELMLKYRGLLPEIIAGERFHRLFVGVGSDIVAHEDLTPQQAQDMAALLASAEANLQDGGVTFEASTAKFARPLIVAWLVTSALAAGMKIIELAIAGRH